MGRALIIGMLLSNLFHLSLSGQHAYKAGMLSQFNLSIALGKGWKLNNKLEARQIFSAGDLTLGETDNYSFERLDLAVSGVKKLGISSNLAIGYMVRLKNKAFSHRSAQQFSVVNKWRHVRLGHRFAADQTFSRGSANTYRLRYRLAVEIPLNGESIDRKEFYLKMSNEYLGILKAKAGDLEARVTTVAGLNLTQHNKLESGVEYRANSFLRGGSAQQFWWVIAWYLSI